MDLQAICAKIGRDIEIPDSVIAEVSTTVGSALRPLTEALREALGDAVAPVEAAIDGYLPPSPLTSHLPLLTVEGAIAALVIYALGMVVCLVLSKIIKTKWTALGALHNAAMVALSLYMSLGIAITAYGCGLRGWNNAMGTDDGARRLAKLIWVFYISKVFEFTDTLLMILKRNYRQVTVLHVYHHVSVFGIWLLVARWAPGGEAYFSSSLNSAVHVVMYAYYFIMGLTSEGKVRNFLQKRKHYLTLIQMTQLSTNVVQAVYDTYVLPPSSLKYPREMLQLLLWYMVTLLVLFANFLIKDRARLKRQRIAAGTAGKVGTGGKNPTAPSDSKNSQNSKDANKLKGLKPSAAPVATSSPESSKSKKSKKTAEAPKPQEAETQGETSKTKQKGKVSQ